MDVSTFVAFLVLASFQIGTVGDAEAQYLYLDTDRDGISSPQDRVDISGRGVVDVWLVTNANRNADPVLPQSDPRPLTLFSYEFIIGAVGGTVTWGKFVNRLGTVEFSYGRYEDEEEIYIGAGGTKVNPPGKYRLGTLEYSVRSGQPRLEIRDKSHVYRAGETAFGSTNGGKQWDNTLKYTSIRERVGNGNPEEPGDWADADGLQASGTSGSDQQFQKFGVSSTTGFGMGKVSLMITTTRPGFLRVRLYDVRGRVVAAANGGSTGAGQHGITLAGRGGIALASGVYFYKVEAAEGEVRGKLVLLK